METFILSINLSPVHSIIYASTCHLSTPLSFVYQHLLDAYLALGEKLCIFQIIQWNEEVGWVSSQPGSFSLWNNPNCTIVLYLRLSFLVFLAIPYSSASTSKPQMMAGCLFFTCFVQARVDSLDGQQPTSHLYISLFPYLSTLCNYLSP